jgi:hypothetical protein
VNIVRAQSEYIGFIFALIIVVALLIPLMFYLVDVSSPSSKPINYQTVANLQIEGGNVIVFYNSSYNPKYNLILVYRGSQNFVLTGVYYVYQGKILNITKEVQAINQQGQAVGGIPKPLTYNFTVPEVAYNSPLILQISAYNTTVFVEVPPNETAIAS